MTSFDAMRAELYAVSDLFLRVAGNRIATPTLYASSWLDTPQRGVSMRVQSSGFIDHSLVICFEATLKQRSPNVLDVQQQSFGGMDAVYAAIRQNNDIYFMK